MSTSTHARCQLYADTAYMCDKEWDQHANSFELYSELLPRKPVDFFLHFLFFFSMNEWRASASLHPNPLPTGNRAAHSYKHSANRLPGGSGGGLWRIGHLYYITGLQEQRGRKRRKSEWRASPPHSLFLSISPAWVRGSLIPLMHCGSVAWRLLALSVCVFGGRMVEWVLCSQSQHPSIHCLSSFIKIWNVDVDSWVIWLANISASQRLCRTLASLHELLLHRTDSHLGLSFFQCFVKGIAHPKNHLQVFFPSNYSFFCGKLSNICSNIA